MDLRTEKKNLRNHLLKVRDAIAQQQKAIWDAWFCEQLHRKMEATGFDRLHAYWPMGSEPHITPALVDLHQKGVKIYLPKIASKGFMQFVLFDGTATLEQGAFGTKHPAGTAVFDGPAQAILVPGLGFTLQGKRLGYGGGFYDRWLPQQKQAQRWAMAYPFQICAQLPQEPHDVTVSEVWTPG
jgi:5-formyltetrahydrofolate cyclo-ligase